MKQIISRLKGHTFLLVSVLIESKQQRLIDSTLKLAIHSFTHESIHDSHWSKRCRFLSPFHKCAHEMANLFNEQLNQN